jgi:hypothetical protein
MVFTCKKLNRFTYFLLFIFLKVRTFCEKKNLYDSRVIMSLTKFVMQPTLHLHRLCGFKKIYFNFIKHSQHARHYKHICQILSKSLCGIISAILFQNLASLLLNNIDFAQIQPINSFIS